MRISECFSLEADPRCRAHIHQGGMGITNFPKDEFTIYMIAIVEFDDKNLRIGIPMIDNSGRNLVGSGILSLVSKSGKFPDDMGRFWKIFEEVQSNFKAL